MEKENEMNNGRPRAILYHSADLNESQIETYRKETEGGGYDVIFHAEVHEARDYLDTLFDMAEKGMFEMLLITQTDLISRELGEFLRVRDEFKIHDVGIVSMSPAVLTESGVMDGMNGANNNQKTACCKCGSPITA
jgi:DNA invertase Pin-like site-specific DNA recombinase